MHKIGGKDNKKKRMKLRFTFNLMLQAKWLYGLTGSRKPFELLCHHTPTIKRQGFMLRRGLENLCSFNTGPGKVEKGRREFGRVRE